MSSSKAHLAIYNYYALSWAYYIVTNVKTSNYNYL